ncbi:MAG: hypothetical protein ACI9VR_005327, partial [Cognaticolwellia sp.]
AMVQVALQGHPKSILEGQDINAFSVRS